MYSRAIFAIFLWLCLSLGVAGQDVCEADSKLMNSAFVFVKPHANTPATRTLVQEKLAKAGINIMEEMDIHGKDIDEKGLIDQHYYSIASKATILSADQIPVPADQFEEHFGESWKSALAGKKAYNAMEACKYFDCSPDELNAVWQKAEAVKFGGGFYCAKLSMNDRPEIYVFNAFFMAMRSKFVGDNSIHCYVVEWDPAVVSWAAFRNEVLGTTDPKEAAKGSIRRTIYERYSKLGLKSRPNKGENGVHASASPFEGLAEKRNWIGKEVKKDFFGRAVLELGIKRKKIESWFKDPQVWISQNEKGSIFDALEDMDAEECLERLKVLNELNRN